MLGYHGCENVVAESVFGGKASVSKSSNDYDWLGSGSYFWEADPQRALEWARERKCENPTVVGAVIDLGNCLDLTSRTGIDFVQAAYDSYSRLRRISGEPTPSNVSPKGNPGDDRLIRRLDNAVIEHVHAMIDHQSTIPSFDTVRCMFIEGDEAYPGATFRVKSHIQIAVRNMSCIIGYFRLR